MKNFNNYDFPFITYKNWGIIYYIPNQIIKKLQSKDFCILKPLFDKFFKNELDNEQKKKFIQYLEYNFLQNYKDSLKLEDKLRLDKINKIDRIEIMLTNTCNLSCKYCYAKDGTYGRKPRILNENEIIKYLNALFPIKYNYVNTVFFFGGEPLLNFKVIKATCNFFEKLVKKGDIQKLPSYTLVTNGTLITEEIAEFMATKEILITVSIDGPKLINDKNRFDKNGKGTYERIKKGINLLLKSNAKLVCFEVTYNKEHKIAGISKEDVKDFLVSEFGNIKVLIENCNGDNDVSLDKEIDKTSITKNDYSHIYHALFKNEIYDFSCNAGRSSLMLTSGGILYPCHMFMLENKYSFSNENEYEKVYNLLKSVNRSVKQECTKCWARNLCGACPASLLLFSNDNSTDIACINIKNKIEKVLPLIIEDVYNNNSNNYNSLI